MNGNEQQQQQIQVNIDNTDAVTCEECNNGYFTPAVMIRRLSPLVSPTGQEAMVPIQLFQCTQCGYVNEHFLPEELRQAKPERTNDQNS